MKFLFHRNNSGAIASPGSNVYGLGEYRPGNVRMGEILLGKAGVVVPPVQPSILIDFTVNTATVSGVSTPITNLLSITRASSQPTIDASGTWGSVSSNALAMTSAGLQIYQGATNLLLQSQALTTASWTSGNVTIADNAVTAPDGTLTGSTITSNGVSATHYFQQAISLSSGTVYTISGRFRYDSGASRYIQLFCGGGTPDFYYATLDTQTGAVASQAALGFMRARSRALAGGWYQFEVTFSKQGSQTAYGFAVVPALNSTRAPASTLTGVIDAWGFQIETGYVATPYIPTTTATAARVADNISLSGALATALAASAGTVVITTGRSVNGQAATLVDSNGTVMVGKTARNGVTTALVTALYAPTAAADWESSDNTVAFGWDSSGGTIQAAGGAYKADAVSRSPAGTFYLGATGGTSAFHNGLVKAITIYPAKRVFDATAPTPLRSFDTIANFVSNPIIPFNTNANNVVAADAPYFKTSQNVGGTYYALTQGNNGPGSKWQNILVYSTTDFQAWTYVGLAWSATTSAWDDHYLGHPAIINIGGTWYAYYSGINSAGTAEHIGLATSTDFVTWTKYGSNPLITDNVAIPSIIKIGSTYYLYAANRVTPNIVYYTSSDGLSWTLGGIAISNTGSDWYAGITQLNDPAVVLNPQGFYEMTFTAGYTGGTYPTPYTAQSIGHAVSTDGINWTKKQAPILQGDGIVGSPNNKYPGDSGLFFNGSSVWMYYAGVNSSFLAQGCLAKIVP